MKLTYLQHGRTDGLTPGPVLGAQALCGHKVAMGCKLVQSEVRDQSRSTCGVLLIHPDTLVEK